MGSGGQAVAAVAQHAQRRALGRTVLELCRSQAAAELVRPTPGVDTGLLVLERRPQPLVPEAHWRSYRRFVAAGFRHGVRAVIPARTLRRLRLTGLEARDLDAFEWAALFAELHR